MPAIAFWKYARGPLRAGREVPGTPPRYKFGWNRSHALASLEVCGVWRPSPQSVVQPHPLRINLACDELRLLRLVPGVCASGKEKPIRRRLGEMRRWCSHGRDYLTKALL
jgi:hypothetical protein